MDLNPCGDSVSTTGIQLSCMSNKGQLLYIQKFTVYIVSCTSEMVCYNVHTYCILHLYVCKDKSSSALNLLTRGSYGGILEPPNTCARRATSGLRENFTKNGAKMDPF